LEGAGAEEGGEGGVMAEKEGEGGVKGVEEPRGLLFSSGHVTFFDMISFRQGWFQIDISIFRSG